MGFAGLHNHTGGNTYQVPLVIGKKQLACKSFDESVAIYDANFEIEDFALKKANRLLMDYEFDVDLNKTYDAHLHDLVLTFGTSSNPIMRFHGGMKPYELAVALGLNGYGIVLSKREDLLYEDDKRKLWFKDFLNNNVVSDRRLLYYIIDLIKLLVRRVNEKLKLK